MSSTNEKVAQCEKLLPEVETQLWKEKLEEINENMSSSEDKSQEERIEASADSTIALL